MLIGRMQGKGGYGQQRLKYLQSLNNWTKMGETFLLPTLHLQTHVNVTQSKFSLTPIVKRILLNIFFKQVQKSGTAEALDTRSLGSVDALKQQLAKRIAAN